MNKLPVSLVVITLNEEPNLERCLKSVPWVEDIIVLDSGSEDGTVELARKLGARTFVEKFRGYGPQKQRAVELAQFDWVLCLDADEALSEELQKALPRLFDQGEPDASAYEFPRLSFHLQRWIRHGGWYPDKQLRFFNRKQCQWSSAKVHERVKAPKVSEGRGEIYHYPFRNLYDQVQTNNEYSSLAAEELYRSGKKYSLFKFLTKPLSKFVETYLIKGGIWDGWAGFVISVGAAYSVFLKFAKLRELCMSQIQANKKIIRSN